MFQGQLCHEDFVLSVLIFFRLDYQYFIQCVPRNIHTICAQYQQGDAVACCGLQGITLHRLISATIKKNDVCDESPPKSWTVPETSGLEIGNVWVAFGFRLPRKQATSVGEGLQHKRIRTATEAFMMTSSNGKIFALLGPLWGKSTGHRWIPLTKPSDAELWYVLWSAP